MPDSSRPAAGRTAVAFALMFILSAGCGDGGPLIDGALGSDISPDGRIGSADMSFLLPDFPAVKTNRELFNRIYFTGETLCFSFELREPARPEDVRVQFVDPRTGISLPAERIDFHGRRISGFTLLGSLLEKFNGERLDGPVPAGRYCCRPLGIRVVLSMNNPKRPIRVTLEGSFSIRYGPGTEGRRLIK